jgi:hypothetical protein
MPRGGDDLLTPAKAAELPRIPQSTLRTYATEYGALLSREAPGEPAVVGRAFRHRRYSRDDLDILTRAKGLVEEGLSYRLAFSQLAGDGAVVNAAPVARDDRPTTTSQSSRRHTERVDRVASPWEPEHSRVPTPPSPEIRVERVVERIVDSSAAEAVGRLGPLLAQLLEGVEAQSARVTQLERQIDALRMELSRPVQGEDARPADKWR